MHKILLEIGFRQLPHDPGMYRLHFNGDYILLTVYVDDLLYTGTCNKLLNQFEENLAQRGCVPSLPPGRGPRSALLKTRLCCPSIDLVCLWPERHTIFPSPRLSDGPPHHKPLHCEKEVPEPIRARARAFAPGKIGHGAHPSPCKAGIQPWPVAKNHLDLERTLQYFISTPDIGFSYSTLTTNSFNLNGYVNADHAADPANQRSRTGFVFRLESTGPISWNSQKEELAALSSAKAEYIAATAAIREGLYMQDLLQEAKIPTSPTFRLHCDNQSAIKIANKPGFVNRTKHIALRYFFVKDEIDKGKVDLAYCPTTNMAADFLTKRLPRQQYKHCSDLTRVVKQVLQRFDFTYSSPQATPLSTRHSLSALPSDESVEPSGPYPELVGCLMYLMTCTRPDLAYPLSILARYVDPRRHRPEHMAAAKRVLRYLCSTSGLGLVLGGRSLVVLTSHADASWVDDLATQRSSQGYSFSLGSGSVSWRSTRSSSVLSSSCEAEIYAGAMAAQELRWLTYLLTDLGEPPRSPPVLYVDNKAMLALWREHRLEHRTKHIALRYFLARELQQCGQLRLAYVASQANTADIFTKALQPCDHQRFCTMLACFALLCFA
ncbi:unnamed protein product [Closterium sp. NIES-53]